MNHSNNDDQEQKDDEEENREICLRNVNLERNTLKNRRILRKKIFFFHFNQIILNIT